MSNRLEVCFNGCSFTVGEGFANSIRDNFIYDRLVAKKFNFARTNIAKPGSSNYTIFMRTTNAILNFNYDIIFVQWSVLNRLWLSPGPETSFFVNNAQEYRYRDIYISKKNASKFRDTLLILNHDYQNIIDLVDYTHILLNLAKIKNTKVFFINGLLPWQNDLEKPLTGDLNNIFSTYSKSLLDFDNRCDDEILKYFTVLQEKFTTLDKSKWINIFNSFQDNSVDIGPEGHHPGIKSHQWMADTISNFIIDQKICDI